MLNLMSNFLKISYLQVLLILSITETKSILYSFWTLTYLVGAALRFCTFIKYLNRKTMLPKKITLIIITIWQSGN
jgi:hypothetical protein